TATARGWGPGPAAGWASAQAGTRAALSCGSPGPSGLLSSAGRGAGTPRDRRRPLPDDRSASSGPYLPKLSNSPFLTPPRKACHSSDVNLRTGPAEFLLFRTPISPPGRLATSTQLPLA